MAARELARTEYATVTIDDALKLVRFHRTPVQLPNVELAKNFFSSFGGLIAKADRAPLRLLLDMRDGPARNDEEFENVLRKYQSVAFSGFERTAILLRSAVGKLQSNRLSRGAPGAPVPFLDEAEAMAFLLGT